MKKFKHVIIYGHKLHSHTHSYIHWGFYRAFKHLGYDVHWLDDSDFEPNSNLTSFMVDSAKFEFQDCLFITEGQVCKNMPILKGNSYILHNCYDEQMWQKIHAEDINYLKLQVYTDDVLNYADAKLIEPCTYYDAVGRILYMPWSTDLLPHEIDVHPTTERTNISNWIGTIGDGEFGNRNEVNAFINACRDNGIDFQHANNLSMEENRQKISESYMAPAIVGTWQKRNSYIPCRIFKNISYGQFGITNSKRVQDLFEGKLVYSEYEYELFGLMEEKRKSPTYRQELTDLITIVRDNHTYVNRINTLLSVL